MHRNEHHPRQPTRGLTLIEVLIIITILGAIAAIIGICVVISISE
jgi:type II secretory pathway pseudopilin PulG